MADAVIIAATVVAAALFVPLLATLIIYEFMEAGDAWRDFKEWRKRGKKS